MWRLIVAPEEDYLVREATFGASAQEPKLTCTSRGAKRFGDVTLAAHGEFVSKPRRLEVRLVSFSPTFDDQIFRQAQEITGRARTRMVQVMDYRENPKDAVVRVFQAGELDR
jgi:hypothetical protein